MKLATMSSAIFVAMAIIAMTTPITGLDNGLARTPQMGWNSWNRFYCSIDEALIRKTVDSIVTLGLAKAGYRYVNLDDCWQISRDKEGVIQVNETLWPSGIAGLASYVHSKNLLFGLYSDAGNYTCQYRPGSINYEKIDAITYAKWQVDYLKYDNCNNDGIAPETRYPVMRDALNATGRHILFSMCEWGVNNPATWAPRVGNSWRTTGDIGDNWKSMLGNLDQNDAWAAYAGPGGWNDPDMLEVGNGGMTYNEYVSHFSLWALVKAPLLIGCDLTHISNETLSILTNTEVIAINQDALGVQGRKLRSDSVLEIWGGPLADRAYALILFNRGETAAKITADFELLGIGSNYNVRDLWQHKSVGTAAKNYTATVQSHSVVFVKLTPA